LMVAAERAFTSVQNHDELALLNVASKLPSLFAHEIPNPANRDEDLAKKLDKNGTRQAVIEKLSWFHLKMQQAVQSPEQATAIFKECFGPRFPDAIQRSSEEKVVAAVLATPPRKVSPPIVKRSRSGQEQIIKRTRSG